MKVDKAFMDFLRDREGLRLSAYLDSGGVPTIGIGSVRMFGKPVKLGMTCTVEQAYEQCAIDVEDTEQAVNKLVKVQLTQNQYNALVSLAYNIGTYAFSKSTLLRKLNVGDYEGAAEQFLRWCYDNGKKVQGLLNRRVLEKELFLK